MHFEQITEVNEMRSRVDIDNEIFEKANRHGIDKRAVCNMALIVAIEEKLVREDQLKSHDEGGIIGVLFG